VNQLVVVALVRPFLMTMIDKCPDGGSPGVLRRVARMAVQALGLGWTRQKPLGTRRSDFGTPRWQQERRSRHCPRSRCRNAGGG